jgi:hypothetical protein
MAPSDVLPNGILQVGGALGLWFTCRKQRLVHVAGAETARPADYHLAIQLVPLEHGPWANPELLAHFGRH